MIMNSLVLVIVFGTSLILPTTALFFTVPYQEEFTPVDELHWFTETANSIYMDWLNQLQTQGSSIVRSTINGITSDSSNPDCSINPTTTTPTTEEDEILDTKVTETSTETTSITSTITSTDISTETSTESFTETSTEVITETSTETQTDTVTETPTITNSAATTVYEVRSIVISEVSTAVITLTESPSCDIACSSSEMVESSTECSTFSTVYIPYSTSLSPSYTESDIVTSNSVSSSTFGGFMASDGTLRTRVCRNIIYVTPDPAQTEAAIKSIVNELTVEKGNLTAVVIKKISAEDQRPSSTVMGYAGIVFLIIPIILMIIVDVPTYYMAAQAAVKFCKKNNH